MITWHTGNWNHWERKLEPFLKASHGCLSNTGPKKGRGSSAHTNLDHLYTQAFLTYCAMHSGSSAHTRFLSSGSSVHTHTLLAGWGGWGGGIGKHTRSSAPAQHCGGGGGGGGGEGGMVSTPAQAHPLSPVSTHAEE